MSVKEKFYEKLAALKRACTDRSVLFTTDNYCTILCEVKEAYYLHKNKQPISTKQYRRLKRYDILKIGDDEKLIEKTPNKQKIREYCKMDDLFDVLEKAHVDVGHKRTRVMEAKLKQSYCNVTRELIDLYLSLCEPCQLKKKLPKRRLVVRPVLSDLIDTQSKADGAYIAANVPYKLPRLLPGAIPSIFPDSSAYPNKINAKRKLLAVRTSPERNTRKRRNDKTSIVTKVDKSCDIFESLWKSPELITMPTASWGFHKLTSTDNRQIAFVNIKLTSELTPIIERQVIIKENLTLQFYNGISIISSDDWKWKKQIRTASNVSKILAEFSSATFCSEDLTTASNPKDKDRDIAYQDRYNETKPFEEIMIKEEPIDDIAEYSQAYELLQLEIKSEGEEGKIQISSQSS